MKSTSLLFLLLHGVIAHLEFLRPTKLQTTTSAEVQRQTALGIISKYSTYFDVQIDQSLFHDEKDVFSFYPFKEQGQNTTMIKASSGVAAVWGFHYFIKKYFNAHIGWQVSNVQLPYHYVDFFNETVVANDRFRYYQNVCTMSYSFIWWSERDWIEHIAWMAMNGINLALAPLGQEETWMKIYREIGMTEDEISEHFTGPAFLSWLRMGNMRGWGGPLPPSWQQRSRKIQSSILEYMRNLGMVPVMPAFAGHVPRALKRLYPNATLYPMQQWNSFSDKYCCPLFVDPSDPLFQSIGEKFLSEMKNVYGTGHIYNSDPFNEIKPSSWSTQFVESVGAAIFSSMRSIDSEAVWLLQNWMFVNAPDLWPRDRVKLFLQSVPRGRMLVLDLQSEQWPHYNAYDMYFGQPFVWCMLHNFGGTLGMFGNTESITKEVYRARSHEKSTMIGIGLTPEGINQNYVIYELMLESAWRPQPIDDLEDWTAAYAQRRYGCNSTARAWRYLLKSVYSFRGLNSMHGQYAITMRPSLRDIKPWAWYNSQDLIEAWKEFVLVAASGTCNNSIGFLHDLTDLTRQVLQYRAEQLYREIVFNFNFSTWATRKLINTFLEVMTDMETILSTNKDFQLYDWLEKARSAAVEQSDAILYEMNARNQITLWGPNGEISDYACKQWAGMFEHYYIPRWRMFLAAALDAKTKHEYFDEKLVQRVITQTIEREFIRAPIKRPIFSNSTASVAVIMFQKWYLLPNVDDLPKIVIWSDPKKTKMLKDVRDEEKVSIETPHVSLVH